MISNVLCLTLLVAGAVAQPTTVAADRHHKSHSIANKDTPPTTPKSPTFGRSAPLRRSTGLDALGSPNSVNSINNNLLSIPILSNIAGDNSNSHGLLDLRERDGLLDDLDLNLLGDSSENHQTTTNIVGDRNQVLTVAQKRALLDLRERGLLDGLDDLDLNVLGDYTENHQTTTNVAGNNNDVTTLSHKRALLDLGNVNVLGHQSESTTTTTNVQGNGNNVNVNSLNNNRNSNIDNSNDGYSGRAVSRVQRVHYDDDEDDFVCTGGSNRGRSGGQRNVKAHPTHTHRAVKQRKEAYRSKVAKQATSTWKPTHRATNNYVAACPTQTVTKWNTKWNQAATSTVTRWNQAAATTVTKWNDAATVTKWNDAATVTKTVTRNVYVASPTPTRAPLLDLDLDAKVARIATAAADLKILRD
ncbi:DNA-binding protein ABF1 [Sporobolomyces koalae]|uniref:DNA-binding protein ABF1 n=1 Tax=Sporobolomyces koalae TaxID=500713 RepID=UPI00316B220C